MWSLECLRIHLCGNALNMMCEFVYLKMGLAMAVTSMLAVNIGNTVTKIGLCQHDTLVSKWTVTTPATITVTKCRLFL